MDDLITATSMALMKAHAEICRLRAINAELVAALELALTALMALHPDAASDMTDAQLAVLYNSSLEKTAAALARAKEQV